MQAIESRRMLARSSFVVVPFVLAALVTACEEPPKRPDEPAKAEVASDVAVARGFAAVDYSCGGRFNDAEPPYAKRPATQAGRWWGTRRSTRSWRRHECGTEQVIARAPTARS